jgi:hypothetical protein
VVETLEAQLLQLTLPFRRSVRACKKETNKRKQQREQGARKKVTVRLLFVFCFFMVITEQQGEAMCVLERATLGLS